MRQYFQFSGVITVFARVIIMPLAFACITPRDAPTLFKHKLQTIKIAVKKPLRFRLLLKGEGINKNAEHEDHLL